METLLRVTALRASYSGEEVLHGVELEVGRGQLVCVLGPSGSGKTTLLRVIAGLEQPTSGSVTLAGRDLADVPPHERGVGLMFQDYALFPHRDVAGNVAFGLRMRGTADGDIDRRVAHLLDLVGLPGAQRRGVSQLSGGEQQRVALARALAPEPELLLLDEPMGSLDRALRERLPEELRDLFAELGLSVIYVTHDQDEALTVADRVALLHEGRIEADAPPEALWTRPPTAWAARFLGFRNVAEAGIAEDGVLITPWGDLPASAADVTTDVTSGALVVLRPAALVLSDAGAIEGVVDGRHFRGDHVLLTIRVGEAPPLYVEVRDEPLPSVGDEVNVDVRPGGAHVIVPTRALLSEP